MKSKSRGSSKGASFEREFCRQLSLWYSSGESKDEFWRTPNSGGKATVSITLNKRTQKIPVEPTYFKEAGDIRSVTQDSAPFCDEITVELKRGYNTSNILFDLLKNKGTTLKFLNQAKEQAQRNKTPGYWLVFKQDRKPALIMMPEEVHARFTYNKMFLNKTCSPTPPTACFFIEDEGIVISELHTFFDSSLPYMRQEIINRVKKYQEEIAQESIDKGCPNIG